MIVGSTGADRIDGGYGRDWICGRGGRERLSGGYGSDRLWGGPGNDLLDGQGGGDRILGGSGNDIVHTAGTVADRVDCGAGRDRVSADQFDRASRCERRRLGERGGRR